MIECVGCLMGCVGRVAKSATVAGRFVGARELRSIYFSRGLQKGYGCSTSGCVYGFVDVVIEIPEDVVRPASSSAGVGLLGIRLGGDESRLDVDPSQLRRHGPTT